MGQAASDSTMMCFLRREARDCTRAWTSSHAKNFAFEGAKLAHTNSWKGASTPPNLTSL
jgi:hypothetical protein